MAFHALQKIPNKEDTEIISYNSRALTEAEKLTRSWNESVYGFERNRLYLIGRQFTIYNKNKAIVTILNKQPRAIAPLRI